MSIFSTVKNRRPKFSTFDLSHEVKLTCNIGELVPVFCQEVLPGDRFRVNTESLVRFAPMIAPIMQRVNVYTHFFFVPNRLLWDNWEDFITGGPDGKSSPLFPQLLIPGNQTNEGGLADYLGIRPTNGGSMFVNALPFKAYQLIYNDYYRDQNLEESIDIHPELDGIISSPDKLASDLSTLRTRAWHKDYFTSALPWTQRGDSVVLPLVGEAPVTVPGSSVHGDVIFDTLSDVPGSYNVSAVAQGPGVTGSRQGLYKNAPGISTEDGRIFASLSNVPDLHGSADMSSVSSVTINELRRANALQRWLEKNARGGARYIEQILSHFGVRVADYRLQRPQFLGGGKSPVMISEVLQNSASVDGSTPQANMAGHGVSASSNHAFTSQFYEHGFVIGIMSVIPYSSYQDGVPRVFGKFDKFDYAFPEFAHLGEQPIYNSELYVPTRSQSGDAIILNEASGVFGYTPRYAEYKFIPSSVHGDFRKSLDFWHMGRTFDSQPALNNDFVKCDDPNINRVFAVQDSDYDHLWIQLYNNVRAIRPLPKFGTPSL